MQVKAICFALVFSFWVGWGATTQAQKDDGGKRSPPGPKEFIDQYNERFEKKRPLIGSVVENLKAYDEQGNAISFNDFRGKYTVLTFGCLT